MIDSKIINSTCICKMRLNSIQCEIVMIEPCEHLIHIDCLKKLKTCPFCESKIDSLTHVNDYINNPKLSQKCVDILSMSSVDKLSKINYAEVLANFPCYLEIFSKISTVKTNKDVKSICESIFSMGNITIKVNGLSKLKNNDKKVFISNHLGYMDGLILHYILGCGFLASSGVVNDPLISKAFGIVPLLLVQRGKNQNTVEQMKKFVKKHGSLCIFPEGMFSYPNTMSRFRTGAFKIGEPIYPIVLKLNKFVLDTDPNKYILKVCSNLSEIVEINILDPIYPPFNDNSPEMVRRIMSEHGLMLSRCLGNDYVDNFNPEKLNKKIS